jgi:hypothetical protein
VHANIGSPENNIKASKIELFQCELQKKRPGEYFSTIDSRSPPKRRDILISDNIVKR